MAKSPSFKWTLGDPPPPIQPHSVAKLDVLHDYLTRYIETLASSIRVEKLRFDVVDGFAGGGLFTQSDGSIIGGSPITFIDTIEAAKVSAGEKRGRPLEVDVHYYFVDKDRNAIDYLRQTLIDRGYEHKLEKSVTLICDDWLSVHNKIVEEIANRRKSGRSIFFLDQCGYTDVPLRTVQHVLSKLTNAEIILNFATDFLATYLTDDIRFRSALRKADIDEKILDDPEVASRHKGWRFALEREISRVIRAITASHYSTPFYVVSEKSQNAYWLVHLCLHPKANDEMLKTHWSIGNQFRHYGGAGTDMHMWGYSAKDDPELHGILELGFEDIDQKLCIDALTKQLPEIISEYPDGMSFAALKGRLKNNTVVSQDIVRDQLISLQRETNDIEILTPKMNKREAASGLSDDDIIRKPLQTFMDFKF